MECALHMPRIAHAQGSESRIKVSSAHWHCLLCCRPSCCCVALCPSQLPISAHCSHQGVQGCAALVFHRLCHAITQMNHTDDCVAFAEQITSSFLTSFDITWPSDAQVRPAPKLGPNLIRSSLRPPQRQFWPHSHYLLMRSL